MAEIHHTKKRMPLIIDERNLNTWITAGLPQSAIIELMQPCDDKDMAAYPVPLDVLQQSFFKAISAAVICIGHDQVDSKGYLK